MSSTLDNDNPLGALGFGVFKPDAPRFLNDSDPKFRLSESDRFTIWIVTPAGYSHSQCFEDIAFSLQIAFRNLGLKVSVVTDPQFIVGTPIVLGPHLLSRIDQARLPRKMVLFNLEQVYANSPWITPEYKSLIQSHMLWDYSEINQQTWAGLGIKTEAICEVGYVEELNRIKSSATRDIDVLFIGSLNERRKNILDELNSYGISLYWLFDVYGKQRDDVIARAKILLNLHLYEAHIFEIIRVSYLLANRCCVVSEIGVDSKTEKFLSEGIAFCSYDSLVQTCLQVLGNEDQQEQLRNRGFELMSRRSQTYYLKNALKQSRLLDDL